MENGIILILKKTNIVLLPVGWETHVSPESGNKPQEIINKRILSDCDLLVGVIWTKVGTQTDKYESGTIEEIEEHIKSGKPAMIYFSKEKINPDEIDKEQYDKLRKYKKSCTDRSIYRDYNDKNEFKNIFYEHLQIKINEHEYFNQGSDIDKIQFTDSKESIISNLSEEARIMLKEASKDINGSIFCTNYLRSLSISTNGKELFNNSNPREKAKWKSALEELLNKGFINSEGDQGKAFKITNRGYEIADLISI